MVIIQIIMFLIILVASYWAYALTGNILTALAALFGPIIAWFAGAGLKGSLQAGPVSQQLGGVILTLLFGGFAYWILHASGYNIKLGGIRIDGELWGGICFIIGMLGWRHRYILRM